ncbi:C1 family peptidase [Pigmentibacter sp. JX0631]|uniref:C1 family peptidase n=1 Tax=Pigmentibacter sp. JX0631 TaxID=2976982 RepID=UPI002468C6E2|nr:C1 family peptidase [Pigmentibacter sp. JX0631]WGL60186.1 C1 family peptidase [Pigmentibacter sp. JX0631]
MRFPGKIVSILSIFNLLPLIAQAQSGSIITDYANINGYVTLNVEKNDPQGGFNPIFNFDNKKEITFMNVEITPKMEEKINYANYFMLFRGGEKDYRQGIVRFSQSANAVDLKMANVPVLDQGRYGTCVTFSSTAALDARFAIGDYIDQQCALALTKTLGNNYWNGAWTANDIIQPLKKYGITAKNYCFGSKYPNPNQTIDINQYTKQSYKDFSDKIQTTNTKADLNALRQALAAGHRVLIGFLYNSDFGTTMINNDGSQATQNRGGLWACYQPQDTRNRCVRTNAGHEVIVIGYDDNQQLLKIRNSWSTEMGDSGDYYMTYNYFNAMTMDQTILY